MTVELYCGDAIEVMRGLPDNSIDLIATDPPYFKVKGEAWDRQWDKPEQFLAWLDTALEQMARILKPNGSLYLFASPKMAARVEVLIGQRFNVLNHIVWKKENGARAHRSNKEMLRQYIPDNERIIFAEHYGADNTAKGDIGAHFFQPVLETLLAHRNGTSNAELARRSNLPLSQVSHYFCRSASGWRLPNQSALDAMGFDLCEEKLRQWYKELRQEYEELRRPFSVTADVPYTEVWTFPTVPAYPGKHPCEKPLRMLRHIIEVSSKPGATVLDCFMGSGTTGVAAQELGRNFIGVELDAKYFAQAQHRITEAQAQLPLLELA